MIGGGARRLIGPATASRPLADRLSLRARRSRSGRRQAYPRYRQRYCPRSNSPECEDSDVTLRDIPVNTLSGQPSSLSDAGLANKTLLVVNVASRCGLTPQYAGLEALHEQFADRAFSVVGFPCNQFMGQEPGGPEEIAEFCSTTYGVTFPRFEKIDVTGDARHPIYAELTAAADASGAAGDVQWNFEKFLVGPDGSVLGRFRPRTEPDAPALVAAIEASLAAG